MNVIQEQVQHQQYGFGNVTEQTEIFITVQFCDEYGIKKFLYPSAFEKYLVLCNPALQDQINEDLQQMREQIEAEQRQHNEELRALLEKKRASAKKTPANPKRQKKNEK